MSLTIHPDALLLLLIFRVKVVGSFRCRRLAQSRYIPPRSNRRRRGRRCRVNVVGPLQCRVDVTAVVKPAAWSVSR